MFKRNQWLKRVLLMLTVVVTISFVTVPIQAWNYPTVYLPNHEEWINKSDMQDIGGKQLGVAWANLDPNGLTSVARQYVKYPSGVPCGWVEVAGSQPSGMALHPFGSIQDGVYQVQVCGIYYGGGLWAISTADGLLKKDTVSPIKPEPLVISITKSTEVIGTYNLTVSWAPCSDATSGVKNYTIWDGKSKDAAGYPLVDDVGISTVKFYKNLLANNYMFTVIAYDYAGNASEGGQVSFNPPPPPIN